jgi:hypothetical protein
VPETAVAECPVCLRSDCTTVHRECSGEPVDEAAATPGARLRCDECGDQLLEAAELCGFCPEEREACAS